MFSSCGHAQRTLSLVCLSGSICQDLNSQSIMCSEDEHLLSASSRLRLADPPRRASELTDDSGSKIREVALALLSSKRLVVAVAIIVCHCEGQKRPHQWLCCHLRLASVPAGHQAAGLEVSVCDAVGAEDTRRHCHDHRGRPDAGLMRCNRSCAVSSSRAWPWA